MHIIQALVPRQQTAHGNAGVDIGPTQEGYARRGASSQAAQMANGFQVVQVPPTNSVPPAPRHSLPSSQHSLMQNMYTALPAYGNARQAHICMPLETADLVPLEAVKPMWGTRHVRPALETHINLQNLL